MRLFPVTIKRTTVVGGGAGGSTVARLGAGIATKTRLTWRSSIGAGVAILPRYTMRSRQGAGVALSGRYSGTVRPTQVTGIREVARIPNGRLATQRTGAEIVRIQTDLTHRRGGSTVVTSTAWTNPANAIDGTNARANATVATATGSLGGGTATLVLSYPAQADRTALTITAVTLRFYVGTSAAILLTTANLSYSLDNGGTFTALGATLTASLAAATPQVFDVTAAVGGDWTKIAALRSRIVSVFAAASAAENVTCDAIEVEVVANNTLNV